MFSTAGSAGLSNQSSLETVVKILFPNESISTNSRKSTSMRFPESGNFMEVDIWLPDHNVCFEFQDEYHYVTTWYNQNSLQSILHKDTLKYDIVRKNGQTVITVPCWWDGSKESLTASVNFQRPDLLPGQNGCSISLNPEVDFFTRGGIPDVGELMLASFPVAPTFATTISEENPWWMGEKYDGIRFCWNPEQRKMYTRSGMELDFTPDFESVMPLDLFVDGEVWFGRGNFPDTQALSNSSNAVDWDFLRMLAFDAPLPQTQSSPFEKRYQSLLANLQFDNSCVINAPRVFVTTTNHLSTSINEIIKQGGEGVILRKPKSSYDPGRSTNLIKLKATRGDSEAIVLGVTEEGDLNVELPTGKTLVVPSQKIQSRAMPKKGDIVSLSYETYSRRGVPMSPKITQIRTDLSWEEVVFNARKEEAFYRENEMRSEAFTSHPMRYWSAGNHKNMRLALEEFAWSKNLDPLLPDTWYGIPRKEIEQSEVGNAMLKNIRGGLAGALVILFPEIGLEEEKFEYYNCNLWQDAQSRREWFDEIAEEAGFDPLVAENWYNISTNDLHNLKGAGSILRNFYSGSLVKALVHLYPEVNWKESNFYRAPLTHWRNAENRRIWFVEFAEECKFDPFVPGNWYKISLPRLQSKKGANIVLRFYAGSISKALLDLFPEIGLEEHKFRINKPNHWQSSKNRKAFFEDFARKTKFDPLIAENWYRIGYNDILALKGGKRVLKYHHGSLPKALMALFPSVSFNKIKFKDSSRRIPQDTKYRRSWFDALAAEHKFDPLIPSFWYKLSENLDLIPGIQQYLRYYSGSLYNALVHLYPEMKLDRFKFKAKEYYWQDKLKRRRWFDNFAKSKNFDPLNPNNWYPITSDDISAVKAGDSIIKFHSRSYVRAIVDAYPDIGLQEHKFSAVPKNYWQNPKNRRKWFDSFAAENSFDPLVAENWHQTNAQSVLSAKAGQTVLGCYGGSYVKAVVDLYPDINLDETKFMNSSIWKEEEKRRKWFIRFAQERKFDPLVPENWYPITVKQIVQERGAPILKYYSYNLCDTLSNLFPELAFEPSLFSPVTAKQSNPAAES